MITSWDIYWITRLDSLSVFFSIAGFGTLTIFICFVSWIVPMILNDPWDRDEKEKYWKPYKKSMVWGITVGTICAFIGVFIPTTKEFAAIYLIPKIANNEQMQKIPDNAAKLLNAKLEQWIDEKTETKKSK